MPKSALKAQICKIFAATGAFFYEEAGLEGPRTCLGRSRPSSSLPTDFLTESRACGTDMPN